MKCRLCDLTAIRATEYSVVRDGEVYTSVAHATCALHYVGLRDEMVRAGWVETPVDKPYLCQHSWMQWPVEDHADHLTRCRHCGALAQEDEAAHMPLWADDKTAQMLGVAQYGCPRCGRGAIAERDATTPGTSDD